MCDYDLKSSCQVEAIPYLGHLIRVVGGAFRVRADALANSHGLTSAQTHLLHCVTANGGSIQQKEIVKYMHVSHPTVIGLLSRMEKKGFVEIHQDPDDRRNRIIQASPKAFEIQRSAFEDMKKTDEIARNGLTDSEYDELLRLLRIVYNNLHSANQHLTNEHKEN